MPDLHCSIDEFAPGRANLIVESGTGDGPELGLYAHLDTSLTSDPERDAPITGRADPTPGLTIDAGDLVGLGLAVARATVAAALVAVHAASAALVADEVPHRLRLLLAAGGTHRWPFGGEVGRFGDGVRHALASGFRPDAVLNVKAGAPAPLHEEPGAAYLDVRITGEWGPALFRGDRPGMVAALGPLVRGVERWRSGLVNRPVPPAASWGREAALGAVRAGSLDKPDLLPAAVAGRVFVVLGEGDDPHDLAAELRAVLADELAAAGFGDGPVVVDVAAHDAAGRTDPDDPIVRLAVAAWTDRWGPPPAVSGWRGSTDGVVFRHAGIPTVRVGPQVRRDASDPRLDRVSRTELAEFAALYADIAVRWVLTHPSSASIRSTGDHV